LTTEEIPEDYAELKAWMTRKEEFQKEIVEQMPAITKEIQARLAAEAELKSKLNELMRERRIYEDNRDRLKSQARADSAAMVVAKRKLETFASEAAIAKRLKSEAEEFDRITQMYQWRGFAFSHQIDGARRLASARRGILGDKRGLGKSLTSLIWADMLGAKKVLVFAPKDVLSNFKREIEHWTPHRNVEILSGMSKVQRTFFLSLLAKQEQFLILVNYEAWRRDAGLIEQLKALKADSVIIDEAHNIKEKRTSAYKGIRDIVYADNQCSVCGGDPEHFNDGRASVRSSIRCSVCLHEPSVTGEFCSVKNILPMTGTAILNKPQDLWTLLNLVDRVLFPSESAFLQDYCMTDLYTGRWRFRAGGEEALIKKLGTRFVKRTKEDAGVETKSQIVVPHYFEFDKNLYPDQWKVMEQIKEYGAILMAENVKLDVIGVLPVITRRRQAITWPQGIKIFERARDSEGAWYKTGRVLYEAPATESIKMDKAMEIANEIINEDEDRLVIFSQFKEALKEFERRFLRLGITVCRYDGDISSAAANVAQLDFDGKTAPNHPAGTPCNTDCVNNPASGDRYTGFTGVCPGYKFQVILCHYKKGGVGLNLNAARQMIILDREWNPGKEDQAFGRIDRLDNTHDSIVHTLHVEETIDAFMDALNDEKKQMLDGFDAENSAFEKILAALRDGDLM
jgi:Superfamily II DNA/RNA helicases, SNF2 family